MPAPPPNCRSRPKPTITKSRNSISAPSPTRPARSAPSAPPNSRYPRTRSAPIKFHHGGTENLQRYERAVIPAADELRVLRASVVFLLCVLRVSVVNLFQGELHERNNPARRPRFHVAAADPWATPSPARRARCDGGRFGRRLDRRGGAACRRRARRRASRAHRRGGARSRCESRRIEHRGRRDPAERGVIARGGSRSPGHARGDGELSDDSGTDPRARLGGLYGALATGCGYSYRIIDDMTLAEAGEIFRYWEDNPPSHLLLQAIAECPPNSGRSRRRLPGSDRL